MLRTVRSKHRRVFILLSSIALALLLFPACPPSATAGGVTRGGMVSGYGMDGAFHLWQPVVKSLAVFQNTLYVGTSNQGPGDIWSWDGMEWQLENPPGFWGADFEAYNAGVASQAVFNGYLYIGTLNLDGCEIWRSDGSSWVRLVGPGGSLGRGFGDTANLIAASMCVLGNRLYVGTANYATGLQVWGTSDGTSWTRVDGGVFGNKNVVASSMAVWTHPVSSTTYLCVGTWNDDTGCQVWGYDTTGWVSLAADGFGNANNAEAASMAVFGGQLYVGTRNEVTGLQLMRHDGTKWTQCDGGAFGPHNTSASSMVVFGGQLYVGTANAAGAQVWRSPNGSNWTRIDGGNMNPGEVTSYNSSAMATYQGALLVGTEGGRVWAYDGESWSLVNTPNFTTNANVSASRMTTYRGLLYAGTGSPLGCEVWSFDGSTWTAVGKGGLGNDKNRNVSSMQVFGDRLYVGTSNYSQGCEVWRYDGNSWQPVVGPGGSAPRGFGNPNNTSASCMAVYLGPGAEEWLIVGTANDAGCEVWAYNGSTWVELVGAGAPTGPGFGDPDNAAALCAALYAGKLYVGTSNHNDGGQVWVFQGASWAKASADGFGTAQNRDVSSMTVYGSFLVAGTYNYNAGCEVWAYDGANWAKTSYSGFGSSEFKDAASMAVFEKTLYVGTSGDNGGVVFSADHLGDPEAWTPETAKGFGTSLNYSIESLEVYFSSLIAGVANYYQGCSVWALGNTWYLAEGCTDAGFETYVLVQNPGVNPVHVDFTLNTGGGEVKPPELQGVMIPAGSRRTFNLGAYVTTTDVSTTVECRDGLVTCERAMYWRAGAGLPWTAGHDCHGVNLPSSTWYLAEGCTDAGFETYVLVQNPGGSPVHVDFTLNTGGGEVKPPELQGVEIGAGSRRTFLLNAYVTTTDVSTRVDCLDGRVICERAMYWRPGAGTPWAVGHDSVGLTSLSSTWYLAEGATDMGFETYVLVQNPGGSPVHVDFTLNTGGGEVKPPELQHVEIGAGSRRTFLLNAYVTTTDVSTRVSCTDGLVACERAMYWRPGAGVPWAVGHNGTGVYRSNPVWYLPEGATDLGFESYVLVQNPGGSPVHVDFTLNTGGGEVKPPELQHVEIGAGSRRTFNLGNYVKTTDVSTKVLCRDGSIICERAVYWRPSPGSPWTVGHNSRGISP